MRKFFIYTFFFVIVAALVIQCVALQYRDGEIYSEKSFKKQIRDIPIRVTRATIYDRNFNPIAVTIPMDSLFINRPRNFLKNENSKLLELSKILKINKNTILSKVENNINKNFIYIERKISPNKVKKILDLNLKGIAFHKENHRFYPEAEVTSHIIGKTNIDDIGQSGMEETFNKKLSGENGVKKVMLNRKKEQVKEIESTLPVYPDSVHLTIDNRIQYAAYKSLKEQVIKVNADSGSIIVVDSTNGEILALANSPSYNPNNKNGYTPEKARNRAIKEKFDPGSTIKPFLFVAAQNTKNFFFENKIDTSPGKLKIGGGYTIEDTKNHGILSADQVLIKSSNVGSVKISEIISQEDYYEILSYVGFGEDIDINLSGINNSTNLKHFTKWKPIDLKTYSYGYGLNVTPLQLVKAYTVIANNGKKLPLKIIKEERSLQTISEQKYEQNFIQVKKILQKVVEKGTAKSARLDNFTSGGKTGTTRIYNHELKKYFINRHRSIFVGMTPMNETKLVILVVIENPKNKKYYPFYGGIVAGPVFKKVATESLRILNIHPDKNLLSITSKGGSNVF